MLTPSGRRVPARRFAAVALALAGLVAAACGGVGGGVFRQYEYEEEIYLSLDGTATVYVNSSVPALVALRGASLDTSPTARLDRTAVRNFYTSPVTRVTRVSTSRRSNRRFVHVRLDVGDVRRLGEAAPFAWSTYQFVRDGSLYEYRQAVGPAAGRPVANVGWTGRELVAIRLHLPSEIVYHNTLPGNLRRGNILVWEQSLDDRLRNVPLALDLRMKAQSILNRTLWLFGLTFVAVAVVFLLVIWWLLSRGAKGGGGRRRGTPRGGIGTAPPESTKV
jgi:hypothetical protein